jgi:hypothetical protein
MRVHDVTYPRNQIKDIPSRVSHYIDIQLVALSELLPSQRWPPVQRMRVLRRPFVLFPNLDSLVRLASDQSHARQIKSRRHDACFRIQRTRLRNRVFVLEFVTCLPIPEADAAVVAAGEKHVVLVDGESIDDTVVAFEVLHKVTAWAKPLLDLAR